MLTQNTNDIAQSAKGHRVTDQDSKEENRHYVVITIFPIIMQS